MNIKSKIFEVAVDLAKFALLSDVKPDNFAKELEVLPELFKYAYSNLYSVHLNFSPNLKPSDMKLSLQKINSKK